MKPVTIAVPLAETCSRSTSDAKLALHCQNSDSKIPSSHPCPPLSVKAMPHLTHSIHTCRATSAGPVRVFSKLVLLCWDGNFPPKCHLLPQPLPFVFLGSGDTPAFPLSCCFLGLGFVVLSCFSFRNKLNSPWAILSEWEKEPFGSWWFNQANPVTSLSCDQWELIPSPPVQGGVAAKKHKLEGQDRSSSSFVVSENMVIPAASKHGSDLWPGRNLEIFSKRFCAVGGKVDVSTLGWGC